MVAQLDAAVADVFSMMLGLICTPASSLCPDSGPIPSQPLNASIRFAGTLEGSCILQLSPVAATRIQIALLGDPEPHLTPDLIGELCNMIAGSWKSRLSGPAAACALTPPTVSTHPAPAPANPPTIRRSYHFDQTCLSLELTLL